MRPTRQQAEHEVKVRESVADYVAEVRREQPDFIRASRRAYLEIEIKRLTADRAFLRLNWAKAAKRAKTKDRADMAAAMAADPDREARLKKLQNELAMLGRVPGEGRLDDQDVARARAYPLWKLVQSNPGARITCPFHDDKKRTLALYDDGKGHCFSCNKSVDSIAWLMHSGLTFFESVRRLF